MKGNYKYLVILFIITCFIITGCSCTREEKIEANQNVSLLKFYVPTNFKNRSDLRGAIYNDDSRKVFAKGDTNDYSTFMYIDVTKQVNETSLDEQINDINTKNLTDKDVKFVKKEHKLDIYARDGYETQQGDIDIINYAYITKIDNANYIITISGPKEKIDEVKTLAINVFNSLEK